MPNGWSGVSRPALTEVGCAAFGFAAMRTLRSAPSIHVAGFDLGILMRALFCSAWGRRRMGGGDPVRAAFGVFRVSHGLFFGRNLLSGRPHICFSGRPNRTKPLSTRKYSSHSPQKRPFFTGLVGRHDAYRLDTPICPSYKNEQVGYKNLLSSLRWYRRYTGTASKIICKNSRLSLYHFP